VAAAIGRVLRRGSAVAARPLDIPSTAALRREALLHHNALTVLRLTFFGALLLILLTGPVAGAATEHRLTLEEAVALAVDNHEGILVERAAVAAADAAIDGARGAYDPAVELAARWGEATEPVTTTFPGAPLGQLAASRETTDAGIAVRQLLPTGGALSLRTTALRESNDFAFASLSPAYTTRLGVELRQPLLRDRSIDGARFALRAAAADRTAPAPRCAPGQRHGGGGRKRLLGARRRPAAVDVREEAVRLAEEQLVRDRPPHRQRRSARRQRSPSRAPSSSAGAASCWPPPKPSRGRRTHSSG
jgi:hypothetical protein